MDGLLCVTVQHGAESPDGTGAAAGESGLDEFSSSLGRGVWTHREIHRRSMQPPAAHCCVVGSVCGSNSDWSLFIDSWRRTVTRGIVL